MPPRSNYPIRLLPGQLFPGDLLPEDHPYLELFEQPDTSEVEAPATGQRAYAPQIVSILIRLQSRRVQLPADRARCREDLGDRGEGRSSGVLSDFRKDHGESSGPAKQTVLGDGAQWE